MDHNTLLDMATDLGYRLAMCGAETYRVEDSVNRIMATYGIKSEVFSIPNCLIVGMTTAEGKSMSRMRRIGFHGNDLDGVERYNSLSRRICTEKPEPEVAVQWLKETDRSRISYSFPAHLLGHFLGGFGFSILFGGRFIDGLCAGICGILIGLSNRLMDKMKVNTFFNTMASAFLMAFAAYAFGAVGIASNADSVVIGALMLLVPGLLITNAMRDIIFGDTNSGINRIMQVFLIAAAIALGTGVAWRASTALWGEPVYAASITYSCWIQILASFVACIGFSLIFNIHGSGFILCVLGGAISWTAYLACLHFGYNDLIAFFCAGVISSVYSEAIARIRKFPAISYLVISIIPLIPGSGVYYTTNYLVRGDMSGFAAQGTHAISIAGVIAVGILMVSTLVHLLTVWRNKH